MVNSKNKWKQKCSTCSSFFLTSNTSKMYCDACEKKKKSSNFESLRIQNDLDEELGV